uniref:Uncharacterized protein n=1 Tax=Phlebotomus papatasi TaxID=29031 RepID=A0A1B0EWM1_PHLPP
MLMETYDNVLVIAMSHVRAFMNIPKMTEPSAETTRRMYRTVTSSVQALDSMDIKERDIWLIYLILEKLDPETKVLWSRVVYNKIPTWTEFVSFLSKRYKTMEAVITSKTEKPAKRTEMKSKPPNKAAPNWSANLAAATSSSQGNTVTNVHSTIPCACCGKSNHRTVKCYKFRGLNDTKRFEIVRTAKLCINCLDPGHSVNNCQSSACKHCAEKHSTWLHFAFHPEMPSIQDAASANLASIETNAVTNTTGTQPTPVPGTSSSLNCTAPSIVPNVLLATAVIYIQTAEGDKLPCRAVLDSGSQVNIITEKMCQLLKLPKRNSNCRLEGVGAQISPSRFQVTVNFSPRGFSKWTQTDCFVQTKITGLHPAVEIPKASLPIPSKLVMADPQWYRPQPIDILIGGQHYWDLVLDRTIRMGPGLPVLKQSVFGWLVVGEIGPIPAAQESPVKREAFVKKRLEDILNNTRAERWHHVPTTHNPADLISRGVTAEQLDESSLWWKGPDWLSKSIEYWPTEPEGHQEGCLLATTAQWPDIREYLYQKSNSFSRIRRVIAWILRFLSKITGKGTQQSGPLLPEEIQRAEIVLVRLEQQELLVDDIKTLSGPKKTPVSKQLRHLQVFLDDDKRPIHVLAKLPTESEHPETSEVSKCDFSLGNVLAPTQS